MLKKIKLVFPYLVTLYVFLHGITKYLEFKSGIFLFFLIIYFFMLLFSKFLFTKNELEKISEKIQLKKYKYIFLIISIIIFCVAIYLKKFLYVPLGQNGINNIDIFFYIIMGISVSNYNVFLILDDI